MQPLKNMVGLYENLSQSGKKSSFWIIPNDFFEKVFIYTFVYIEEKIWKKNHDHWFLLGNRTGRWQFSLFIVNDYDSSFT